MFEERAEGRASLRVFHMRPLEELNVEWGVL